jgi:hypothetical protein
MTTFSISTFNTKTLSTKSLSIKIVSITLKHVLTSVVILIAVALSAPSIIQKYLASTNTLAYFNDEEEVESFVRLTDVEGTFLPQK